MGTITANKEVIDLIEEFEADNGLQEIILLGNTGVRRIILNNDDVSQEGLIIYG